MYTQLGLMLLCTKSGLAPTKTTFILDTLVDISKSLVIDNVMLMIVHFTVRYQLRILGPEKTDSPGEVCINHYLSLLQWCK